MTDPYSVVVITLFPEMFDSFYRASLIGKAMDAGLVAEHRVDPREFTSDVHRTVDDAPFGGGSAEKTYRSLLVTEYAKQISQNGGLGITDQITRDLIALQEGAQQ